MAWCGLAATFLRDGILDIHLPKMFTSLASTMFRYIDTTAHKHSPRFTSTSIVVCNREYRRLRNVDLARFYNVLVHRHDCSQVPGDVRVQTQSEAQPGQWPVDSLPCGTPKQRSLNSMLTSVPSSTLISYPSDWFGSDILLTGHM
jgi:hypothetical protein